MLHRCHIIFEKSIRDIGKEAVNGVLYATVVAALQDEIGADFEKRYKAKFGPNAGHLSGCQPYDGAYIWAAAAAMGSQAFIQGGVMNLPVE